MRIDHNGAGETFWTVRTPAEFGGIDISLRATATGVQFGGEVISWSALDDARTRLRFHADPVTNAQAKDQATRCGCRGFDDYCPCQNVAERATPPA